MGWKQGCLNCLGCEGEAFSGKITSVSTMDVDYELSQQLQGHESQAAGSW